MISIRRRIFVIASLFIVVYYLTSHELPDEAKDDRNEAVHSMYGGDGLSSRLESEILRKLQLKGKKPYKQKFVWRNVTEDDRLKGLEQINEDISEFQRMELYDPSRKGRIKRILVATTWRSGSTFLSELLTSLPASYHHYEPLMEFQFADLRDPALNDLALEMLIDLFRCQYSNLADFLQFSKGKEEMFSRNVNLWKRCRGIKRSLCYDVEFLEKSCPLFPLQIMKTVRLPLKGIEKMLGDDSLNLQVIFLVRDPRGIISSRKLVHWCNVAVCSSPRKLCDFMEENVYVAQKLLELYPERFIVIRYEDLAMEPMTVSRLLFKWLKLPWLKQVELFIQKHTNETDSNPWGTKKEKGSRISAWTRELAWSRIQYVQDVCRNVMDQMGYLTVREASVHQDQTFTNFSNLLIH